MSLFIGGNKDEVITPDFVSPSVGVVGRAKQPSSGTDIIFAGGGDDIVAGGGGTDIAFLGAGNDTFIWNPGDGSDIVFGGRGIDTLDFNGSNANETVTISAGPFGGARFERDVANVTMTLDRVERIDFAALGGADVIKVGNLARTDIQEVAIDLAGTLGETTGDGADDKVVLDGTKRGESIEVLGEGSSVGVVGLPAFVTVRNAESNDELVINGFGGNDTLSAAALPATSMRLTLDGGDGNDTIFGSAGADILIGGDGNDVIDGNGGNDAAFLGAGDDLFVWDPGDGSDVIEGQAGFDELTFNGSGANETIDISADGARARFFRDVGNITMDTNEVEIHHFNALGGEDTIIVNDLTGTDVQHVGVDLAAVPGQSGDEQQDAIVVNGSAAAETIQVATGDGEILVSGLAAQVHIFGQDADGRDRLQVSGGAGDDTIDASALAANAMQLTLEGGAGNDTLFGSAGAEVLIGGEGNDVAFLGAGDDMFVWDPGDGSDVIEGQAGLDTLVFNGSGADEVISLLAFDERVTLVRSVGNIRMDMDDVERIEIATRGGEDFVLINDLTGTDVSEIVVDLGHDGEADQIQIDGPNDAVPNFVTVTGDASQLRVDGFAARVRVTGAEAENDSVVISGSAGNDVINASGVDSGAAMLELSGGDGNDILIGGDGDGLLFGGDGNDVLIAGAGDHRLEGGDGDDVLIGGSGNNVLYDDDGDNLFVIGAGSHTDIEFFRAGAGSEDRIDLRGLGGQSSFESLLAQASEVDGDVVFDFGETQLTLLNSNIGSLHQDDFLI